MAEMRTDAAALSAEAANFDRIGSELRQVVANVDGVGGEFAGHWSGAAGTAVQQALQRFNEASQKQVQILGEISNAVNKAGVHYSKADDEHASSLTAQMNF